MLVKINIKLFLIIELTRKCSVFFEQVKVTVESDPFVFWIEERFEVLPVSSHVFDSVRPQVHVVAVTAVTVQLVSQSAEQAIPENFKKSSLRKS